MATIRLTSACVVSGVNHNAGDTLSLTDSEAAFLIAIEKATAVQDGAPSAEDLDAHAAEQAAKAATSTLDADQQALALAWAKLQEDRNANGDD